MSDWWTEITPPSPDNMMRIGSYREFDAFVRNGRSIADRVAAHIKEFAPASGPLTVLDFGAGVGRVALPMWFDYKMLTHVCDVDASAMEYLAKTFDEVDVKTTNFKPPLPYDDNTFDVVYSISIWTHLHADDQIAWLKEMRRIIKPGGYLMATTSSYKAIDHRKNGMKIPTWQDVTYDDLRREGILYRESPTLYLEAHSKKYFPGITDSYGQTSNDPAYIINHWSEIFEIKRHYINDIGGIQDMNILKNPK